MKRKIDLIWLLIWAVMLQFSVVYAQHQSDLALIRRPIFQTPLTYKLTRSATNDFWGKNLYGSPRGIAKSYIMSPSGDLLTAMTFDVDYTWDRIVYSEIYSNWIRSYGSHGTAGCMFWSPRSIVSLAPFDDQAYSYYHYVLVADAGNGRITRLRYNWTNQTWQCFSPITAVPLDRPLDIDLNENFDFFPNTNDYIWAINGSDQVLRFDLNNGTLLNVVGEPGCDDFFGNFCRPTAIVSGRSYFLTEPYDRFANTNDFYVADAGKGRIVWMQMLSDGQTFTRNGTIAASSSIVDLETDIFGNIWAVDRQAGIITKYRYDLWPLCKFGATGVGENEFLRPVAISNSGGFYGFGNMSIAESWSDSSGMQYFAIGTDILDFAVGSTQDQRWHYMTYTLIDPSWVSLKIYNVANGALVKSLFNAGQFCGPCSFVWDGSNNSGQQVASGNYRAVLIDTSTYSNSSTGLPANVVTKEALFYHEYNPYTDYIPGDTDDDGDVNILDVIYLVNFKFKGGPAPQPYLCVGDVDANGSVNILDINYLIVYLYHNGEAPRDGCQL